MVEISRGREKEVKEGKGDPTLKGKSKLSWPGVQKYAS